MKNNIPREEMAEWLANPTTIKFKGLLEAVRKEYVDALAGGVSCLSREPDKIAIETVKMVSYIAGLDEFLKIDVTDDIESLR